jgi:hypothetical protein
VNLARARRRSPARRPARARVDDGGDGGEPLPPFTASGVVCLLVAALGGVFILSSSRLDPMDIPALYGLAAFFLGFGCLLLWNGGRRGAEGRCLDDLRRQLAELEQAAFIDDVERLSMRG